MDSNELLKAIKAAIEGRFPDEPVCWDQLPQEPQRPSFTLECRKDEGADVNIGLVRRTLTVLVTCYPSSAPNGDSPQGELGRRMEAVLGILSRVINAGGRMVTANGVKGMGRPDCAKVQAVFTWADARAGYQDPDRPSPGEGGPRMEDYQLNVNGKD